MSIKAERYLKIGLTYPGIHYLLLFLVFAIGAHAQTHQASYDGKDAMTYRKIEVMDADGLVVSVKPIPESGRPLWASGVPQKTFNWKRNSKPYFADPIPFVIPPEAGSGEPFYEHNHQPSITWLDNGDLMAIWYSTITEQGTELTVVASRMRSGKEEWDPCSEFFKARDRNMHGSSIFNDGKGKLFHFNGMGAEGVTKKESKSLAMVFRVSVDNGVSWSPPSLISPYYKGTHQPVSGGFVTSKGTLIQICDSMKMKGSATSALFLSHDGGQTWKDPGEDPAPENFTESPSRGRVIAGIHAGAVELADGRLMALGRRSDIDERMPLSISDDMGRTWKYQASPFPPIGGGQRLVLMRLIEGPILLISFTDKRNEKNRAGMPFTDQHGRPFKGYGLFAAISYDEGQTWPTRKLITPGKGEFDGGAWTGAFTAAPAKAEHGGYLAATQSPDGIVHLVSSRLHYRFNLEWLKKPNVIPEN